MLVGAAMNVLPLLLQFGLVFDDHAHGGAQFSPGHLVGPYKIRGPAEPEQVDLGFIAALGQGVLDQFWLG